MSITHTVMPPLHMYMFFLYFFSNREFLMKFFYPQEYKTHQPTPRAEAGEKRQFELLAITVNIVEEATMDILFTKNKVIGLSVCCCSVCWLPVHLPLAYMYYIAVLGKILFLILSGLGLVLDLASSWSVVLGIFAQDQHYYCWTKRARFNLQCS